MNLSPRLGRIVGATLLAAVAAVVAVPASPAQASTGTFRKDSVWDTGYTATFTVRNDLPWAVSTWRVQFEVPEPTTITYAWNASMTKTGTRYVLTPPSWAPPLPARSTTTFGLSARGGVAEPLNCLTDGVPCAGTAPARDTVPPSPAANLRLAQGPNPGTITYVWDAATDNVEVAGYQLFANGSLLATTTGTSHSGPVPPPMIFLYAVRAFDASGNVSSFTYLSGPGPDRVPPTVPTQLRLTGIGSGYLRADWAPSNDNVRVAGYEVFLNGSRSTAVDGTIAYLPYRGYGTYLVDVRSFDASGNFSDRTRVGIAIDPPAPPPAR
jgi:hypothetical protein